MEKNAGQTVALGFLTAIRDDERECLERERFPSKVGGKPAWLNPRNLPHEEDLCCRKCNQVMTFLLQLYLGSNEDVNAHHRGLFLFCCQDCTDQFLVYRCQLPLDNPFYPPEHCLPSEVVGLDSEYLRSVCCSTCGIPINHSCATNRHLRCRNYATVTDSMLCPTLNEFILDDELEAIECQKMWMDEPELDNIENTPEGKLPTYEVNKESELDDSECIAFEEIHRDAAARLTKGNFDEDIVHSYFVHRCGFSQSGECTVVRYVYDGLPLWYSKFGRLPDLTSTYVPDCENCGAARVFECQVQPELISLLGTDRLSYGIVCIFTCSRNCVTFHPSTEHISCSNSFSRSAYLPEFVYCQPSY